MVREINSAIVYAAANYRKNCFLLIESENLVNIKSNLALNTVT